ncbi:MAG: phage portal protein, partial [Candidatus Lokiarchaeota archaeon]|nr:phage portal protein [Candidatus Lokiarchaeota archaeon]
MAKVAYTDGRKAVTLADMDEFLDWLVEQGGEEEGEISVSVATRKVAFVYRCVTLIADAIRRAPFQIVPVSGEDPLDESADYQNALGFLSNPKRITELVIRSLLGSGNAYLFKANRGRTLGELKYVVASTIEPQIDGEAGLVGFKRKVNGKEAFYPADKLIYFWPPDEGVELGEAKSSPVIAALMAAGANYYTSRFIADFFARGAIKGTLIAVKGNPPPQERDRIKDWFKRMFGSGTRSQFGTDVINADALEPIKIGEGLEGLNNSELTEQMREDIAVALGVPMSKLLSSTVSGLGGGGVAESDDIGFYRDTVAPWGDFIADTLNYQLLVPLGYRWEWLWHTMDIFQQDERERAVAFKTYVDARMRPEVAAAMLGLEIPDDAAIPDHYVDAFEEKQEPPGMQPGGD